jgi:hypothetical protein
MDNKIPADPEFIKTRLNLNEAPNLKELIVKGFLIDASNALADCKQVAIPEAEAEAYSKEVEKESNGHFDKFWSEYPRKIKKKDASKIYSKIIKTTPHETIMNGLHRYKSGKPDYADWQHPTTWLNGEGWNDEYEPKGKLNGKPTKSQELDNSVDRVLAEYADKRIADSPDDTPAIRHTGHLREDTGPTGQPPQGNDRGLITIPRGGH